MTSTVLAVLDVVVGIALLVTGFVAATRRRSSRVGALLAVTGLCWFVGSLVGSLVLLHRGPLVHVHLTYPTGRPHQPRTRVVIAVAYAAAIYDGVVNDPRVAGVLALLLALAALDLYLRTSGSARKAGGPALAAALAFSAALAASSANLLLHLRIDTAIAVGYDLVVALIAVGLTVDLLRGRWTEATIADLVSQLSQGTDPTGLQAALRQALGDPALTVGYRDPTDSSWIDDAGRPFALHPGPDQAVAVVKEDGRPVAVVVHAAAVLEDHALLESVTAVVRLAVGNARMRAAARTRAQQLQLARRRVVEAGDAQRRALVKELQDGAERHLAAACRHTDRVAARSADGVDGLRSEAAAARAELRTFAQGVRPPILEVEGLPGALATLAERSAVPVAVRVDVDRLDPAVEAAVYFVCAEALTSVIKHADAATVEVDVRLDHGAVVAHVIDDGRGGANPQGSGLRGLRDRMEALGGRLDVISPTYSGTTISARAPLGQPERR